MDNRLLPYLGKVGTGRRGAKDLTYPEARGAMEAILDGAYHPITLGAFLLAERWKMETPEELAAFADAVSDRLERPDNPRPHGDAVDSAGAYDGKTRTLNVGIAAALIAAGAGVPVVLHGAVDIPTKQGMTPAHVLDRLGLDPARPPERAQEDLETVGVAYLHQPLFNPGVHRLLEERQNIGKRTLFNTIEPAVNPLSAGARVGGIFHPAYAEPVARAMALSGLGFRRAVIVQGIEGSDEIRPGKAQVAEWKDGTVRTYAVESAALGLPAGIEDVSVVLRDREEMIEESAARIAATLAREDTGGYRNVALLNAALRIYAGGGAPDWEGGVAAARRSLESGAALDRWRRWEERAGKEA